MHGTIFCISDFGFEQGLDIKRGGGMGGGCKARNREGLAGV